jgi:hypothetical protein
LVVEWLTAVERTVVVVEPVMVMEGMVWFGYTRMAVPGLMGVAELTVVVEWLTAVMGMVVVVVMEGMVEEVVEGAVRPNIIVKFKIPI